MEDEGDCVAITTLLTLRLGTTKFRHLLQAMTSHLTSLLPCDWLKEVPMVEISSYRRTLVHRCFKTKTYMTLKTFANEKAWQ